MFFFPMVFCFFQWNLDPLHPPNFDGWLMLHPPKVDRDRTHLKPWKWQKKPWSLKTCPKDKAGPNQPHSVPTFWHLIEYFLLGLLGGHCWTCWQGQTFLEVIEVQSYRNPCVEFSRFFSPIKIAKLLGGLEHEWIIFPWIYNFPFSWECRHPNWRSHIFQDDPSSPQLGSFRGHPWWRLEIFVSHDTWECGVNQHKWWFNQC